MKKIICLLTTFIFILFLISCDESNNSNNNHLYFDDTGIAETTHIVFTDKDNYDLKDVFKVGNRISAYNDKVIGKTTYDDIEFYIYEWGGKQLTENDNIKLDNDGIVTKKQYSTNVIYATLKEDTEEEPNRGLHVVILIFGNDKTIGTWVGENDFLDIWLDKQGEDAKKATLTFELKDDLSYKLTITEGYYGTSGIDNMIESEIITGSLYWNSGGLSRLEDGNNSYSGYDIEFKMIDNKFTLVLYLKEKDHPNTSHPYYFYQQEN